jgi:hypothetical protein
MEQLTILTNLLAMTISLWLSLYIITRSPHSPASWLAGFTCGSGASLFLRNLLAGELEASGLFPWPRLVGLIGLMAWQHMTHLFFMESAAKAAPSLRHHIGWLGVCLSYGLGCVAIIYDTYFLSTWQPASGLLTQPDIYHLGRYGPLHPLIIVYFVGAGLHSLLNLWQAHQQTNDGVLKRVFRAFFLALLGALVGGLYLGVGRHLFTPEAPAFLGDLLIGAGIAGVGYTVARYRALIDGRTIQRDLLYNLLGISLAAFCYGGLTLTLGAAIYGEVNLLFLVLLTLCAIVTHSLFDAARSALDRIFYHQQAQQLHVRLRNLAREVGAQPSFSAQLEVMLRTLQHAFHTQTGFIAIRQEDLFVVTAPQQADAALQSFTLPMLMEQTVTQLSSHATSELPDVALLAPLRNGAGQIGALALGAKTDGSAYSAEEREILETMAQQMAALIHQSTQPESNRLTSPLMLANPDPRTHHPTSPQQDGDTSRPLLHGMDEERFAQAVNECLKQLNHYARLGEHALAQLKLVTATLNEQESGQACAVARGKALRSVLLAALCRLRPDGPEPGDRAVAAQETWHAFLILRDLYELGCKTNEVMWKYPYAEKTFYRRRSEAVKAVAATLWQMEQELKGVTTHQS